MEEENAEKEEREEEEFVISELSKFIEQKLHALGFGILHKFEEFTNQYDADQKRNKEQLKLKFEKLTRHLHESVFTIINKGQRFESDLDKIYKKMLKLFVSPNHQNIAKTMFLREQQCKTLLNISDYTPPNRFGYACPEQRSSEKLHEECAGKYQSPIAISCNKAVPLNMPAIDMTGYRNLLPTPIKLTNNGHTINMSIGTLTQKKKDLGDFLPYISGGKLEGIYEVNSLHFHWGDKNNRGAEHILNDVRYAMEMHIVHKNTKYKDVPEAMTYSDGLAVMAFFFEMSEFDGPELNVFVKNLPSLKNANDAVELGTTFSLHSLISSVDLDRFYTYKGSLTTPPYSEAVTWVIFPDPISISLSHLSKFRDLHSSEEDSPLVDNFRNVQPIGNRRIFVRKVNTQNQSLDELDEVHYSKWGWFI